MNNTTSKSNEFINGWFYVLNYGGFLTRFFVQYTSGGIIHKKYSGIFPVGQSRKIIVPSHSTDISFLVQIESFPFVWAGIYENGYNSVNQRCFVAYGLSFLPFIKPMPCTSPRFKNI